MKLLVAGSRDFNNKSLMHEVLDFELMLHDIEEVEVISGGARGADTLAGEFCIEYDLREDQFKEFKADWDTHGKSAGHIRNWEMGEYLDGYKGESMAVLFWDGKSKGTKSMLDILVKLKINTKIIFI